MERVRVRQGEGEIPFPLTPSRQGRENYKEFATDYCRMKLLPKLVIVLIVCLIAMFLSAVPAQAQQCGQPFIELSPSSAAPGTKVAVNGQRFDENTYVDIYYDGTRVATGRTDIKGRFTILFTVPEGYKGAYEVRAEVLDGTAVTHFTVKPGVTVSPEKGPVGSNVTVKGQGFAKNEEDIELMYYLNGNYETVERNIIANAKGSWQISLQIPPSTRGEHKIDAQGAVSRLSEVKYATFKVTPEISLDKSSGIVGETITMTGSRFAANERGIKILFAGEAVVTGVKANAQGEWEESFEIPEIPTGTYSVTAEGEQTPIGDISELSFEIKPNIRLSPDEGSVGITLTVTGRGFAANQNVDIMYDGSQKAEASSNDQGSFEVSFLVPESQHGERLVVAGYAGENHANAVFTMESDPPDTPELISPLDGSRVGFVHEVTPTFQWSEVSDDSGVRYNLQIATSADVTATGEFVAPIVSVSGLVGTSYTLEKKDALPPGAYYWIVQAMDGAENESVWTTAHSFRVGLLPLGAFIAIITATVVLFIALIRAAIIRRRYYY